MENQNFAEAGMLIRKPVSEVFEAFVNPEVTTNFWFTKSSGKLEEGEEITWTWEMYGLDVPVRVSDVVNNEKIEIEWGNYDDMTRVVFTLKKISENETFVNVVNDLFKGNTDDMKKQIRDSTGGFNLVMAGCKAWLEHGINLNLIKDRFPMGK
ncbi:SRPBCC family protein [Chryseobacterium suipulveris]|uniref:SRPBCC family protein n=1 Tax=Chryseobacterium suipulveris TaxID=2929800 RepID=A0ABY4BVV4_9FLAO|nr:SRPBCC family protein [Chryseobacterium suipulveris]UOE42001.1 SRPBCC family protein [Chryseobacterium suipulveris]